MKDDLFFKRFSNVLICHMFALDEYCIQLKYGQIFLVRRVVLWLISIHELHNELNKLEQNEILEVKTYSYYKLVVAGIFRCLILQSIQ